MKTVITYKNELGAATPEYGLLLTLFIIVAFPAISLLGLELAKSLNEVSFQTASAASPAFASASSPGYSVIDLENGEVSLSSNIELPGSSTSDLSADAFAHGGSEGSQIWESDEENQNEDDPTPSPAEEFEDGFLP